MRLQQCNTTRDSASKARLPRRAGRILVEFGIAIAFAVAILFGELWAIRHAPLLIDEDGVVSLRSAEAATPAEPGSASLPVAILH